MFLPQKILVNHSMLGDCFKKSFKSLHEFFFIKSLKKQIFDLRKHLKFIAKRAQNKVFTYRIFKIFWGRPPHHPLSGGMDPQECLPPPNQNPGSAPAYLRFKKVS